MIQFWGGGELLGYYRLHFYFQDKCETKYDSVCRDVQVFCQNFLQIEADCFRLQDTQCQTFEETKCDKELTVEYLTFILFLTTFFPCSGVRGQVLGDLWDWVRGGLQHQAGAEVRGMDHLEIEHTKPVMTFTLPFI